MPRRNKPTQHKRFEFNTSCETKRRFASERVAREAADYQMLVKPDLELTVYRCERCGGWHLTRQTPSNS